MSQQKLTFRVLLTILTCIVDIVDIVDMVYMEVIVERVIDVTEARRQLGTLLDEVFYKKDIITIQRKGKSLAKIIPLKSDNPQDSNITSVSPQQRKLLEEMEGLPVILVNSNPTDILRSIREEKKMKANMKYGN